MREVLDIEQPPERTKRSEGALDSSLQQSSFVLMPSSPCRVVECRSCSVFATQQHETPLSACGGESCVATTQLPSAVRRRATARASATGSRNRLASSICTRSCEPRRRARFACVRASSHAPRRRLRHERDVTHVHQRLDGERAVGSLVHLHELLGSAGRADRQDEPS